MDDAEVGLIASQPDIGRVAIRRELVLLLEAEQSFVKLDGARYVACVDDRKRSPHGLTLTDVKRAGGYEVRVCAMSGSAHCQGLKACLRLSEAFPTTRRERN